MPEVQTTVHVGVREGHHELLLGRAVLVELGLGLEDLVGLPALLGRALHSGQPVSSHERLGLFDCRRDDVGEGVGVSDVCDDPLCFVVCTTR